MLSERGATPITQINLNSTQLIYEGAKEEEFVYHQNLL